MPMQSPPLSAKPLFDLVTKYNEIAESNHNQRLFYLQKINWELNKTALNDELFTWLNKTDITSFNHQLAEYQIDMDASLFAKGFQFAKAVARFNPGRQVKVNDKQINNGLEYSLMQARDNFLENQSYNQENYVAVSLMLDDLAQNNERIRETLQRQSEILNLAKPKISAIKGTEQSYEPQVSYKTKPLGAQGNNQNFTFEMGQHEEKMVFRVEDRADLGLEQRLHSYPVSSYFIEDYSVFMGRFQNQNSPVEYRPVVLSQFARQGNLSEIAKNLKGKRIRDVAPIAKDYVFRLTDFFDKLIDAKAYHPDIKLTNFLVDGNRVLISDRKTLIDEENPLASNVCSSPLYAPDEYLECLNFNVEPMAYNLKAKRTRLNMPQFMSFQLGMALKGFLLLTQLDELPDEFRDRDVNTASYFENPTNPIINLSFLIQELTRTDPTKRMTIKQFKSLISYITRTPKNFYKEVEKVLPSKNLGIQDDIDEIKTLLNDNKRGNAVQQFFRLIIKYFNPAYYGAELLVKANVIFNKISAREDKEDRLTFYAQKLAKKCYNEFSYYYFKQISNLIEAQYLEQDWEQASWGRKALHLVTFGMYRVDRVASIDLSKLDIGLDLKGAEFQSHFAILEYLSPAPFGQLGTIESKHLTDFILAHLEEIMSVNSEDSDESLSDSEGAEDTRSLLKNTKTTDQTMPSGSVVINEGSLPSGSVVINEGSLPSGSVVINEDLLPSGSMVIKEGSLPSGSVVFKDGDQEGSASKDRTSTSKGKPFLTYFKSRFFKSHKEGGDDISLKPRPAGERVASVRTALLRLDGSHRFNKPDKDRVKLSDFNWEPPALN